MTLIPAKIIIGKPPTPSTTKPPGSSPLALGQSLTTEQGKARFASLVDVFKKRDQRWGRWITIGRGKSGKSHAAIYTLPTPILMQVFDPDSEQLIPSEMIEKGLILPIRYYGDDPEHPIAYRNWERDVITWGNDGFFSHFASCVIDSFSNQIIAQLRQIAYDDQESRKFLDKDMQRKSLMPQLQDYNVLKVSTITIYLALCSIPCHLVLNAHILEERLYRDAKDLIGFIRKTLNATPALQANIPPLFSEVYLAEIREKLLDKTAKIHEWIWRTQSDMRFPDLPIGSRMSGPKRIIPDEVPQDFRALLKRCNFHSEDKPPLV